MFCLIIELPLCMDVLVRIVWGKILCLIINEARREIVIYAFSVQQKVVISYFIFILYFYYSCREDDKCWLLPIILFLFKSVQARFVNWHIANLEVQDFSLFCPDPDAFWAHESVLWQKRNRSIRMWTWMMLGFWWVQQFIYMQALFGVVEKIVDALPCEYIQRCTGESNTVLHFSLPCKKQKILEVQAIIQENRVFPSIRFLIYKWWWDPSTWVNGSRGWSRVDPNEKHQVELDS